MANSNSKDFKQDLNSVTITKTKADIKIKKLKKGNLITLRGQQNLNSFNINIPGDPSSAAPFIVLTLLIFYHFSETFVGYKNLKNDQERLERNQIINLIKNIIYNPQKTLTVKKKINYKK